MGCFSFNHKMGKIILFFVPILSKTSTVAACNTKTTMWTPDKYHAISILIKSVLLALCTRRLAASFRVGWVLYEY